MGILDESVAVGVDLAAWYALWKADADALEKAQESGAPAVEPPACDHDFRRGAPCPKCGWTYEQVEAAMRAWERREPKHEHAFVSGQCSCGLQNKYGVIGYALDEFLEGCEPKPGPYGVTVPTPRVFDTSGCTHPKTFTPPGATLSLCVLCHAGVALRGETEWEAETSG